MDAYLDGLLDELVTADPHEAWSDVLGRARRSRRRYATVAVSVVAVALAVPALAISGVSGLLRLSNSGTPVGRGGLSHVSGFDTSGATGGSLVQLASRDGVGVYAAKTATGRLCYFTGPAKRSELRRLGLGGGCMNATASTGFPSPAHPVVDLSEFEAAPPDAIAHASVARLAGVAADGVVAVQVLALTDCHVVASAPVVDNVYVADGLPSIPEAVIVARDSAGNAVWNEAVAEGADVSACGLG